MPLITLTTDFGTKDGFTGVMKGVIWGICPQAQIADITHEVSPQNILEGSVALWRASPFFPPGTIHIAVVDPGVGTRRRPMAASIGDHFFIGPDNGLFTPQYQDARRRSLPVRLIHLNKPGYWLANVSQTFHGRDIFSPAGAHLANGVPIDQLGDPFDDPVELALPVPERTRQGWLAHITVIDTFGNLTTDLPASLVTGKQVVFKLGSRQVRGLTASYGHRHPGDLVALVDSEEYIELAVVNGNAARDTGAKVGDEVEVLVGDG